MPLNAYRLVVIPKCKLHAWILLHNRCLTADNLAKRGWQHDPICKLCRSQPETAAHLSVSCSFSQIVWKKVLEAMDLPVALCPAPSTTCLRECWVEMPVQTPAILVKKWRSVALCSWWLLWKERNNRVFNNKTRAALDVADKIIAELRSWQAAGVLRTVWEPGE